MMMSSDHEYSTKADNSDRPFILPVLSESEVKLGQILGNGAFCQVSSVRSISLLQETQLEDEGQQEARKKMASLYKPSKLDKNLAIYGRQQQTQDPLAFQPPRLAMKQVKDLSTKKRRIAQADLKMELDILKSIPHHRNIIQLHAVGYRDADDDSLPEFLILGKLRFTLATMLNRWRERRGMGVWEILGIDVKGSQDLWMERLVVLSRIADALQFLHSHQVIFRDLKPDNIGFDEYEMVKIFDFGLGKILAKENENEDGTYELTGDTGSRRFMPPEVFRSLPYGKNVDVYSFAIVMYEVLSLKVAFAGIPPTYFQDLVYIQRCRPPLDPEWPYALQTLISIMWDNDAKIRPTSQHVFLTLEGMLRGEDAHLFPLYLI